MKKTILLIVAVFSLTLSAYAHPVSVTFASRVAANYWAAQHPASVRADVTPKALPFPELDQLYIFDMDGLGFVIVPADDRVMPVLAYSFDDPFPSSLNRDLAYWLHGYNEAPTSSSCPPCCKPNGTRATPTTNSAPTTPCVMDAPSWAVWPPQWPRS